MRISKPYSTRIDMGWKGTSWFTGATRRLTDEEAKPLLEKGIIYEAQPKRFVIVDGVKMTWGEYLKRKRSQKT